MLLTREDQKIPPWSLKLYIKMSPERTEISPPMATEQTPKYNPELMRLYHQAKGTSRALMVDDEIDNKIVKLLETCA